jgi:hypothetical protein
MTKLARSRALPRRWPAFIPLVVAFVFAACEDDDDVDIIVVDPPAVTATVAAFRDTTVNFQNLTTFVLPDTVVHLVPATGTPISITREWDQTILDRVRANLLNRGYTEELNPDSTAPSFVVLVGTTATQNYAAWVSYPWFIHWGAHPELHSLADGASADWTIFYPWGPVAGVSTYERGTIIVDLIPVATVNPLTQSISSAWAGVATGLLNANRTASDINAAIDQMFILSPYLRAGPPL